jgi:hypothetical protein
MIQAETKNAVGISNRRYGGRVMRACGSTMIAVNGMGPAAAGNKLPNGR